MDYEIVKLKEIADFNKESIGKNSNYEFINYLDTANITNGAIDTVVRIPIEEAPSRAKRIVHNNDIVYSTVRPNLCHYGILDSPVENMIVSTGFTVISCKDDVNPYYVYNYLTQNDITSKLHSIAENSTSAYPSIKPSDLENIEIKLPKLDIQNKIAKILTDIDKKIKINNEINNNLHELIKSIYSEYLNQLDNYEELDIKEIFDFETGVEPGSKNYTDVKNEGYVKFYRVGDMNSRCNTYVDLDLTKNKLLNTDDIVVSFDATVGRIGYGLEGAYSTGMKKISISNGYKNELDNSIVYAYFNDKTIQDIIKQNARGTTILHASSSIDFMKFKYNKDKIKPFNDVIKVLFNKMKNNKKQNETLEQLRDTLLPKLMNGKIDLDNIEI